MPIPSLDPSPLPSAELRLGAELDAHEASYLAASLNTASFSRIDFCAISSLYVPMGLASISYVIGGFILLVEVRFALLHSHQPPTDHAAKTLAVAFEQQRRQNDH